jgi:hypothetical protein
MTTETLSELDNQAPIEDVAGQDAVEPKEEGLSNREALQKAIEKNREEKEGRAEPAQRQEAATPSSADVKQALAEDIDPPPGFSKDGAKAWKEKDIAGIQKEFRRIDAARTVEVTRAQTAERQAIEKTKPITDLVDKVKTYLAARGDDTPDEIKIAQALQLVNTLRSSDRKSVKAELKAAGIDLDAEPSADGKTPEAVDSRVQEALDALLEDKRQRDFAVVSQTFGHSIGTLAALKNRTGDPVFPDFQDTSEAGIQFAKEIGSLTKDAKFQQGVLRRFPDADHTVLVREAYKYLGGKVSGEPVKVSPQETQKHIEKSRRAAASTPGRVVARNESSNLIGKLSRRAALQRSIAENREH